jgi:hypothetical protein
VKNVDRFFDRQHVRFLLGVCAAGAAAALIGWGCEMIGGTPPPPVPYTASEQPVFLITYYPYRPDGSFLAQPIPNYRSWTGERMERDLRRMSQIGLDGVLVAITPELFGDAFRRSRLEAFVRLAGTGGPSRLPMRVSFFLEPSPDGGGTSFSRDDLGGWFVTSGLRDAPGCLKIDGRPVVVVGPGVSVTGPNHPAVSFLMTDAASSAEWHWPRPGAPGRWALGSPGAQVLVRAGFKGNGVAGDQKTWQLPRDRGKTLQYQLWKAFERHAMTICVSSWNDFTSGDFIEPNSLDGQMAYDILALEIARARSRLMAAAAERK